MQTERWRGISFREDETIVLTLNNDKDQTWEELGKSSQREDSLHFSWGRA